MATTPTISLPNLNPSPQGGVGAYGAVPGAIPTPTTTYGQTAGVIPMLPNLSAQAGNVVGSELAGQVSPETAQFLQQKAAEYGVSMGLPGSPTGGTFTGNNLVRSLGLSSEQLQQAGLQGYAGILSATAQTQLQPELQAEVAQQNALNAAAPNPAAAARELQSLAGASQKNEYSQSFQATDSFGNPIGQPKVAYKYYA